MIKHGIVTVYIRFLRPNMGFQQSEKYFKLPRDYDVNGTNRMLILVIRFREARIAC